MVQQIQQPRVEERTPPNWGYGASNSVVVIIPSILPAQTYNTTGFFTKTLHVESEIHDVTIVDDVILSFNSV